MGLDVEKTWFEKYRKNGYCNCGHQKQWAEDPNFPVEYDKEMNEYSIIHGKDKEAKSVMNFCYWCGGELPKSLRSSKFTTPQDSEIKEVDLLMNSIKTVEEMKRMLGKPDMESKWVDLEYEPPALMKWKKQYKYSKKWKTLTLCVSELDNGKLAYSYSGTYIEKKK